MLAPVLLAVGVRGQGPTCAVDNTANIVCTNLVAVPNAATWGTHSVAQITGELNLVHNHITEVPNNGFDECPYTKANVLALDENEITFVGSRAFSRLSNLEQLFIGRNPLTVIASDALAGLASLTRFALTNTYLTSIPENLLTGLTSLTHLFLEHNQITEIPENLLDGLTNLIQLSGFFNRLTSIPEKLLDSTPKLDTLYLDNNKITSIPANLLTGLTSLILLELNSNDITLIPFNSLADLSSLKVLSLNNNQIGAFDYGALVHLTGLTTLRLGGQVGGGDPSCDGRDTWVLNAAGIQAAIASCGADGSPCSCDAVACPVGDPGPDAGVVCDPDTETAPEPDNSDGDLSPGAIVGIAAGATAAAAAAGYVAYKQIKKPKGGADAGAGADPLLSGGFL